MKRKAQNHSCIHLTKILGKLIGYLLLYNSKKEISNIQNNLISKHNLKVANLSLKMVTFYLKIVNKLFQFTVETLPNQTSQM